MTGRPETPWKPEEVVATDRAKQLIESAFPELAPVRLAEYGVGWDNTAYLANDTWVFRFPRRELAAGLMVYEALTLPQIARRLPLAVPEPVFISGPTPAFRWSFAGYRALRGKTACRAKLSSEERVANAPLIGNFLRSLHELDTTALRAAGLPTDQLRRLDRAHRSPMIEERIRIAARQDLLEDPLALQRIVDDFPVDWTQRDGVLCHGDLYARHLLVDEALTVSGVIDWGDVHLGDPAVDLSLAAGFLPPAAHAAFFDAYGSVSAESWRVARFRALLSALTILLYGADIEDADLVREGQYAIENLRTGE